MSFKFYYIVFIIGLIFTITTYSQKSLEMKHFIHNTSIGRMEFTVAGVGKPVLIVHGGNDNCFTDMKQKHLIENNYQVIIPSRPGYGETSINYGKTASQQADYLKLLIDSLNLKKVALLAHSAGGAVALEFAKKYPQQCVCLILEDAITKTWIHKFSPKYAVMKYIFHPKRQHHIWKAQQNEFLQNQPKHIKRISKMFSTLNKNFMHNEWSNSDITEYGKALNQMDSGEGFFYTIGHKAKDIQKIEIPCLISHSPFDKNVPFSHALYAFKKIKNAELYVSPAKSHLIYMGKDVRFILEKRLSYLESMVW